tara:strand:- start:143 stop:316 length:174 start_codon:yes stop_codon:yes gene_type:complete
LEGFWREMEGNGVILEGSINLDFEGFWRDLEGFWRDLEGFWRDLEGFWRKFEIILKP